MEFTTPAMPSISEAIKDSLLVNSIIKGIANSDAFIVEFDSDDEDDHKRVVRDDIINDWAVIAEVEIIQDENKEVSGCTVHGVEIHDSASMYKTLHPTHVESISSAIRTLNLPW